jgi:16S rRNA (cytidine1402-2'-O)-methyltransferase
VGFLPKKEGEKITCIKKCPKDAPLVFFESAKRLKATLTTLEKEFPIKEICLGKELSKTFETIFTGSINDFYATCKDSEIKGEWVVVVSLDHNKLHLEYEKNTIEALKEAQLSMKQTKKVAKLLGISANKANRV